MDFFYLDFNGVWYFSFNWIRYLKIVVKIINFVEKKNKVINLFMFEFQFYWFFEWNGDLHRHLLNYWVGFWYVNDFLYNFLDGVWDLNGMRE